MSFKTFCIKYEKQLQFFETLAIILVFCLLFFLITEKYFLSYKVVLVEENIKGEYIVVKEIILSGQLSDSVYLIDTTQEAHEKPKLIIESNQNLYNISS